MRLVLMKLLVLCLVAVLATACQPGRTGGDASSDTRVGEDAEVLPMDLEVPDHAAWEGVLGDGSESDSLRAPVPCPAGRGELVQAEADALDGKPCDTTEECGYYWPCQCSAWCDCDSGLWVCNSVCDDSCLDDGR